MTSPAKKLDLDAVLATRIKANVDQQVLVPFDFLGREWHAVTSPSVVAVLAAMEDEDGSSVLRFLMSMIAPDERDDFKNTLSMTPGIDGEIFGDILNMVSEAVAGRPTESLPASSRSSGSRKSGARSTANSSSVAVVDSLD